MQVAKTGKVNLAPGAGLFYNELMQFQALPFNRSTQLYRSMGYGIVRNVTNNPLTWSNPDSFRTVSTTTPGVVSISSGMGVDIDGNLISAPTTQSLKIHEQSLTAGDWWLTVKYASSHLEDGIVNISSGTIVNTATVTGDGNTKFLNLFRGSDLFYKQNFIKFSSTGSGLLNVGVYEVQQVRTDSDMTIIGSSLTNESNLRFSVVSTFSGGLVPADDTKFTYNYDSCIITATKSSTKPVITDPEREFYLARITATSAGDTVQDLRDTWWREKEDDAVWSTYHVKTGANTLSPFIKSDKVQLDSGQHAPYYCISELGTLTLAGYGQVTSNITANEFLFKTQSDLAGLGFNIGASPIIVGFSSYLTAASSTLAVDFDAKTYSYNFTPNAATMHPLLMNNQGIISCTQPLLANTQLFLLPSNLIRIQ
jgi:hypothetical protein